MKAKISDEIVESLLNKKVEGFNFTSDFEPLYKKDAYYSFNGEYLSKPKRIIRERTEALILKPELKDIFKKLVEIGDMRYYITVKEKSIDHNGCELNKEYESSVDENTLTVFHHIMNITNYALYFEKQKLSISYYVKPENEDITLHCEIVNVNNIGPYLEIEVTDCDKTEVAKSYIEKYFNALSITQFEKRDWHTLIEDKEKVII